MRSVYLAGPIKGLAFQDGEGWREYAKTQLAPEIEAFSPLRGKQELLKDLERMADPNEGHPLTASRGIVTRDRYDVRTAGALLVNLLGATNVSIGTMVEYGWADAYRVPIVTVMEQDNIHQHPMVEQLSGFLVTDLDEGIALIRVILRP